ncbi:MAG: LCP family protein [Treponema sp.]|jgi:LCP family protein required for cell wall assembly|nr:LCP family protein [Treponema sp.]
MRLKQQVIKKKKIIAISIVILFFFVCIAVIYGYLNAKLKENSVGILKTQENVFSGEIEPMPEGIEIISEEEYLLAMMEDIRELSDEEFRQEIERVFNPAGAAAGFAVGEPLDNLLLYEGDNPIYKRANISDRIYNVLFLGDDARIHDEERGCSDTIILVSYNRDTRVIHFTSFMRDILAPANPNGTSWNRLNNVYAIGGPGRIINVLNNFFSLDIQRYIVIKFSGVFELIDSLDGLELELHADEANLINRIFPDFNQVNEGPSLLNGRQVLAYSRIRVLGSDFARTQRQRNVLRNVLYKVLDTRSIGDIATLASFVLEHVETNIPLSEIIVLSSELFIGSRPVIRELRIPVNEGYNAGLFNDSYILAIDFNKNITDLHRFVYSSAAYARFPHFSNPEVKPLEPLD